MREHPGLIHPDGKGGDECGREIDQALLSFYAPACIVVTRQFKVVERRGSLAPFGLPEHFAKVPPGKLGDAIRRGVEAASQHDSARVEEVPAVARLGIIPIPGESRKRMFLVTFETPRDAAANRIRDLEGQLAAARQYLATTLEDYESTTEELRSAYEELKAANEELQQLNQDLGSANDSLARMNATLEGRSRDVQRVNAELANLMNSVGIPMLMLGDDLRIRRFNPQAERFFNLQSSDIGKPIRDIRPSVGLPHLEEACRDVLATFVPCSRTIQDASGRSFSLLMRPYRTQENQVDGVVLALVERPALASFGA